MASTLTPPFLSCSLYFSAIKLFAVLITFMLNAPAKPRLDDTTTTKTLFASRSWINGEDAPSKLEERFPKISFNFVAYGRN
ncbi:hypothetical protein D9M68_996540 [compost metagenome]